MPRTLSGAVITPGADKLVDDALDGCDALLVKQLRTERDSAYKASDDAVAAKDAAEATAQRLAADESRRRLRQRVATARAASAAALEKATAASASALTACEASSAAELEKVTAASAATLKQATDAHAAATKDANAQHSAALKEATDQGGGPRARDGGTCRRARQSAGRKGRMYYVAAHSGALAAKDEQHRAAVASEEELLNSKHEAVRASLERRLKEDTEALAKRHAEELARDAEEDAVELEKAVNAAIKSQNEKHAQVIEAELKRQSRRLPRVAWRAIVTNPSHRRSMRQESDFLVWHGRTTAQEIRGIDPQGQRREATKGSSPSDAPRPRRPPSRPWR